MPNRSLARNNLGSPSRRASSTANAHMPRRCDRQLVSPLLISVQQHLRITVRIERMTAGRSSSVAQLAKVVDFAVEGHRRPGRHGSPSASGRPWTGRESTAAASRAPRPARVAEPGYVRTCSHPRGSSNARISTSCCRLLRDQDAPVVRPAMDLAVEHPQHRRDHRGVDRPFHGEHARDSTHQDWPGAGSAPTLQLGDGVVDAGQELQLRPRRGAAVGGPLLLARLRPARQSGPSPFRRRRRRPCGRRRSSACSRRSNTCSRRSRVSSDSRSSGSSRASGFHPRRTGSWPAAPRRAW